MSTHGPEPMTEDEMYALEFSPEELCEALALEESGVWTTCPVCMSEDLDFAYNYAETDPETGYNESCEMYHCRACGSVGDAEECASVGPSPAVESIRPQSKTQPAVRDRVA
jgi:hypothetical protein